MLIMHPNLSVVFYPICSNNQRWLLNLIMFCKTLWTQAVTCYLEMLDNLQKRTCRTVVPSLAASLEPLARCQFVASLNLFYTLVCAHLSGLNWFRFLVFEGGLHLILRDCIIFLSQFLDVIRMFMSTGSFLAQVHSGFLYPQNAFL